MRHMQNGHLAAGILGASIVIAALSLAAGRIAASAQPAAVGWVNLHKALDKLAQRAEMEVAIQGMATRLEEEFKRRGEELTARAREVDAMTDPAKRSAAKDEVALEQLRLKEWAVMRRAEIDREYALRWEKLYRAILEHSTGLAAELGYQYILVNDSIPPLERDPRGQTSLAQQVTEQISRRRVLFAAQEFDVTDALILRMNSAATTPGKETQK